MAVKRLWIVEGPDGGGKTRVADRIIGLYGAEYIHHGPYLDETEIFSFYAISMLNYEKVTVLDRCWLSEAPYGRAFRGGRNRLSAEDYTLLECVAAKRDARIILCLPPFDIVKATFKSRPEYLSTSYQLKTVYDWYNKEMKTNLEVMRYDYTKDNLDELIK